MTPGADSNSRVPVTRVTIVLRSLDYDAHSREPIDGILARDSQSAESILIDGRCMDGTVATTLESCVCRIRWLSQPDQALPYAVNGRWAVICAEWLGSVNYQEERWSHTISQLMPAALRRGNGTFSGASQVRREIVEPSVCGGARGWV